MQLKMLRVERISRESRIRCTFAQINQLVDFMAENGESQSDQEWATIADQISGGKHTVEKLKVTWRDLKKRARQELMTARLAARKGEKLKISKRAHKILCIMGLLKPSIKNETSHDKEIGSPESPRDNSPVDEETLNDDSVNYERIDEDTISENLGNTKSTYERQKNINPNQKRKSLVEVFEELAEDKKEVVKLKKELLLKKMDQQEKLHAVNMQIANEQLAFERTRNEMELEMLKKKYNI